jgi:hypothetical protein
VFCIEQSYFAFYLHISKLFENFILHAVSLTLHAYRNF